MTDGFKVHPRPWHVESFGKGFHVVDKRGDLIVRLLHEDLARLIAAAPRLLHAASLGLPYVLDVIDNPEQLACFKKGVVQKHANMIREALDAVAVPQGAQPDRGKQVNLAEDDETFYVKEMDNIIARLRELEDQITFVGPLRDLAIEIYSSETDPCSDTDDPSQASILAALEELGYLKEDRGQTISF
jgi:hypothetical protein